MRRREFLSCIGALAVWPIAAHAGRRPELPMIGFLGPTSASVAKEWVAVFEERLHQLGWSEGKSIRLAYRWADGHPEHYSALASELVRLKPDLIVTWGTETALAVKKATSIIPVVFTIVGDPVGSGLVESLARPGSNCTGLSSQHDDTAGKRLQLLQEIVPKLHRVAVLVNPGNSGGLLELRATQSAAHALSIQLTVAEVRSSRDIVAAIQAAEGQTDALYVVSDALFNSNRATVYRSALSARLPAISGISGFVEVGGLISYSARYPDLFRGAADYVDKILRGAKPSDLPVEQPTSFELVINLNTAKALGLGVPTSLLARADRIIE